MVGGNSITSENLITIKELINNWQIASISKKKKKTCLKYTSQLNLSRDSTQPVTRLTHLKMTCLTRNPINLQTWLTWLEPNLARPFCHVYNKVIKVWSEEWRLWSLNCVCLWVISTILWVCLVRLFKQQFSVFLKICVSEKVGRNECNVV